MQFARDGAPTDEAIRVLDGREADSDYFNERGDNLETGRPVDGSS
jgi:hypothetical protein